MLKISEDEDGFHSLSGANCANGNEYSFPQHWSCCISLIFSCDHHSLCFSSALLRRIWLCFCNPLFSWLNKPRCFSLTLCAMCSSPVFPLLQSLQFVAISYTGMGEGFETWQSVPAVVSWVPSRCDYSLHLICYLHSKIAQYVVSFHCNCWLIASFTTTVPRPLAAELSPIRLVTTACTAAPGKELCICCHWTLWGCHGPIHAAHQGLSQWHPIVQCLYHSPHFGATHSCAVKVHTILLVHPSMIVSDSIGLSVNPK